MIRILFSSIAFCVFTFVILIGVAVVVGHGQPPSVAVQRLHLLDCVLPCWMGIVPGETRIDEAIRHINDTFSSQIALPEEMTGYTWFPLPLPTNTNPSNTVTIRLDYDGGIIYAIAIAVSFASDPYGMPRVSEIVNLLGTPTCVNPGSVGFQDWALVYDMPDSLISVHARSDKPVIWIQPMSSLSIGYLDEFGAFPTCYGNYPEEPTLINP